MMKRNLLIAAALLAYLGITGCATVRVAVNYDETVDFGQYRTYHFVKPNYKRIQGRGRNTVQNPFLTKDNPADIRDSYDVLKYRLDIDISPSTNSIRASNHIWIRALEDLKDTIVLDFAGLETDSVIIAGANAGFEQDNGQLSITLTNIVKLSQKKENRGVPTERDAIQKQDYVNLFNDI